MLQKKSKEIITHPLTIIVLLYLIANFFMLLNNGWYWDDWCLSSPEGIKDICAGVGVPFMTPIHSWLINLTAHPALLYHILTVLFEIAGIAIFYKLLRLLRLNRIHAFILSLFFALLPYNLTKITLACFMYTIGFFFFLLAALLFIYFIRKNNLILRILSLTIFFLSFLFLPSTLVLALAFILFMAIFSQKQELEFKISYFKTILFKLYSWADFMLIPFVFWIFRALFLKTSGVYAISGYREFSVTSVLSTPFNLILTFIQNFIGLGTVVNEVTTSNTYAMTFVAMMVGVTILLKTHQMVRLQNRINYLFIGLYFFIAGAFAYSMLGLPPMFDSYNSRHQILLKIGVPFILYYIVNLINSRKAQKVIISTIISLFIVATISSQLRYQKSWFKQMALEEAFTKEKLLGEGSNIVIKDNTQDYNEYDVNYAFYCYTGILRKSFGTQTRFAIDSKALDIFTKSNPQDLIKNSFYHMKDCKNITTYNYSLTINPGSVVLSNVQNIKMLYQYYLDYAAFSLSLKNILSLSIAPYNVEYK